MAIYNSIEETIGSTPLIPLKNLQKNLNLNATIYAKLEYFNPAGSVKDRVAKQIIEDAEKSGLLKNGATVIEPTSGNTGIGIAAICASKGYKAIIVMPNNMSKERIMLLKAFGAEVVLTDGSLGMKGAIEKAEEIKEKTENSIIAGQFTNPSNPKAHYNTTGPEIYDDLSGKIDAFVAGIGTGGTITGTAKYLKEKNSNIFVLGIEPAGSPLITKGYSRAHGLQGIGANFIPEILDMNVIDEVTAVTDDDAYKNARLLGKTEGILIGISSGAALSAAIKLAERKEMSGKNIVVLLPDGGDRYLSTTLFEE